MQCPAMTSHSDNRTSRHVRHGARSSATSGPLSRQGFRTSKGAALVVQKVCLYSSRAILSYQASLVSA